MRERVLGRNFFRLLHGRAGGRDDAGDDHLLAVEEVGDARRDLLFPMVALIDGLVERLALPLALKPTQPDIHRLIGFTAEAAGDHHALGDLERDDLLLHDLEPFLHLAGPDLVLAQLVERHRRLSSRVFRQGWVTLGPGWETVKSLWSAPRLPNRPGGLT